MKKNITRIYNKSKNNSRKKYMLIIVLILLLQIAIYFGAFSKAETVIPIEYINYYTLETFDSSIEVNTDIKGKYIVFPEAINNRNIIKYYVDEIEEDETSTKEYKPNDIYYIGNSESLNIKVEYGEEIITQLTEDTTEPSSTQQDVGTIEIENNIEEENDTEQEENIIRDVVYLGNIRTRRGRRNRIKSV